MHDIDEKIYQLAKPYLTARHNDIHTQIALDFAVRLLEGGKGDRRVVVPAIILHDVGYSRFSDEMLSMAFGPRADRSLSRMHEEEGVRIAKRVLAEVDYPSQYVDEILQIIGGHDTRANAISINDEILRDADRLSRYSKSAFWSFVERFQIQPEEICQALEFFVEQWFYMAAAKEMAREELKQRRQELQALRLLTNALPPPGTGEQAP